MASPLEREAQFDHVPVAVASTTFAHPHAQGECGAVLLHVSAEELRPRPPALDGVLHVHAGQLLEGGIVALVVAGMSGTSSLPGGCSRT